MSKNILASIRYSHKDSWKNKNRSGVWDLKVISGESESMRVIRVRAKVKD